MCLSRESIDRRGQCWFADCVAHESIDLRGQCWLDAVNRLSFGV